MEPRTRNRLKAALRIGLSALGLYLVFRQVPPDTILQTLRQVNPWWLVAGLLLYAASKWVSAYRLNRYFSAQGIFLTDRENLRLYWVGMFYNLFLPGGIGGDAYKVWFVHRHFDAPVAKAVLSTLVDRLSGLLMLGLLACLTATYAFSSEPWASWLPALVVLIAMGTVVMHHLIGKSFVRPLPIATAYSLGVQLLQLGCAWTLLQALGVQDLVSAYLTVFLVSSVVAVLPLTIGGIGLREWVFVAASGIVPISPETSVAFSLLFFLLNAASSLPGAAITLEKPVS